MNHFGPSFALAYHAIYLLVKHFLVYPIIMESLTNIVKHAQATEVHVRLLKKSDEAVLVIQDNGIGFDPPRDWLDLTQHGHLGMVGMRERAEAIGSLFALQSAKGMGTQIQVIVPLA
jgi:signal transduction histidine kinase